MVRVDGPHQARGGVELQPTPVMANPAAEVIGRKFDAVTAERDLPARPGLQYFAMLQAELERQARIVGRAASTGDQKTELESRVGRLRHVKFAEESVVGKR